ncbi:hypothetical protein ANCDUO_16741 [Ancylostoma duodenale]|uniref:Acyl-CoA thioesterase-like C-terminal domain-containing protein n=1 Tax=Ancylostoma duodenale TaxID=51022 RepID=A0A0C2G7W6_9BILA|nr:hypothetical protein ANCDUO_16741 [Ancylostoma duodenale]
MPVVPSWKELKCMSDVIPWLKTEIAEGRIKVKPAVERRIKYYESRANQKNGDLFQPHLFFPHFSNDFDPSMIFSLDHNVWMHQHIMRADQWMLFENTSTVAGRGRAFITGKLWSEDGTLILSCAQEIVLRSRGTVSRI